MTHLTLFPIALLLSVLHATVMLNYLLPPLLLWCVDRACGWWRGYGAAYDAVATPLPGGGVRLDVSTRHCVRVRPGAWAYVCVPGVAGAEWHPFSLACSVGAPRSVSFVIKGNTPGCFSARLAAAALSSPSSSSLPPLSRLPMLRIAPRGWARGPLDAISPRAPASPHPSSPHLTHRRGGRAGAPIPPFGTSHQPQWDHNNNPQPDPLDIDFPPPVKPSERRPAEVARSSTAGVVGSAMRLLVGAFITDTTPASPAPAAPEPTAPDDAHARRGGDAPRRGPGGRDSLVGVVVSGAAAAEHGCSAQQAEPPTRRVSLAAVASLRCDSGRGREGEGAVGWACRVRIDGPYGGGWGPLLGGPPSHTRLLLLIAGGVGVTPCVSIIDGLMCVPKSRRPQAMLLWALRDASSANAWLPGWLAQIASDGVEVVVHATRCGGGGSGGAAAAAADDADDAEGGAAPLSASPPRPAIIPGRPDVGRFVADAVRGAQLGGAQLCGITLFACGPDALTAAASAAASQQGITARVECFGI